MRESRRHGLSCRQRSTRPMLETGAGVACLLDSALLMERAGLTPDLWQRQLLRSEARRVLVLAARQVGKSTTAAYVALAEALRPRTLTLCVEALLGEPATATGQRFPEVQLS